jgi:N-acetylmuramoyl-L-alanine amidase
MGRLKFLSIILILAFAAAFVSCSKSKIKPGYVYNGTVNLSQHSHLKGKKIFVDPGHGAKAKEDGRVGPTGVTEEDVNLRAGIILASMLTGAGAEVKLSRTADVDISLDERAKMVIEYKPDIFICMHHNGNPRPRDKVNYPSLLIWGSKDENPASYDLAQLLLTEFNKMFEQKGVIASDYAVFRETGAKVLRETRAVCPGVLGEFGFFTDSDQEKLLKDDAYNMKEAEAYFAGISEYVKRGIPSATLLADQRVPGSVDGSLGLATRHPRLFIRVDSGIEKQPGIAPGSLNVTLNDLPVPTTQIDATTFEINYGSLFAGGHKIRFTFRNPRLQSSMVSYSSFAAGFAKGEYASNIEMGKNLTENGSAREGLQRVLPAIYAGFTDPLTDVATYVAARGFEKLGNLPMAAYYYSTLWDFYPDSSLRNSVPAQFRLRHIPNDYFGKRVKWERF